VVLDAFLLKLMALEGYRPVLAECAACGRHAELRAFSAVRGGALCASCRNGGESLLDPGTVPLLSHLLGEDLDQAGATQPRAAARREAANVVKSYVEYHLDRRLRSYPLVNR
jgi:DNA repair protein RecO (recombination protein O)